MEFTEPYRSRDKEGCRGLVSKLVIGTFTSPRVASRHAAICREFCPLLASARDIAVTSTTTTPLENAVVIDEEPLVPRAHAEVIQKMIGSYCGNFGWEI